MMYLIVECDRCGNRFITTSRSRTRCRYCGKSVTISPKRRPSRALASAPDPRTARTTLLEGM